MKSNASADFVVEFTNKMTDAVTTVFSGSTESVHLSVLGLIGSLHVLVEDIPGVGKTTLARAVSEAAGLSFSRIQFTPDMLPGDVLGMNVWNPSKNEFIFRKGPLDSQCVLADELNRTSPRTQSAFLEAMQEGQVTVDGVTRVLPEPFFLIATQNPQSFTGTFPLPEAELDRFGLSFSIGYPSKKDEETILDNFSVRKVEAVSTAKEICKIREFVSGVGVSAVVKSFIVDIVRETRNNVNINLGASPRASVFLQQAAKAKAAISGRDFVMPEDVLAVCPAVLSHRIVLSSAARLDHLETKDVIKAVCQRIQIPTGI